MGKNTVKNKKKRLAKKRAAAQASIEKLPITELLASAQQLIDSFQYEEAQKLCQVALSRDPDHVPALKVSASLCLETGNMDGAMHCLGRAITLEPDQGHSKYLSMAQLIGGKEAVQCYLKGAEILTKQKVMPSSLTNIPNSMTLSNKSTSSNSEEQGSQNEEAVSMEEDDSTEDLENREPAHGGTSALSTVNEKHRLEREISAIFCSISELYMTDLCDEEDAEKNCHESILKAIEEDKANPEAHLCMASFLLVKQEVEEAKVYLQKSIDLWLPKYKEVDQGTAEAGSFDPVEVCSIPYLARLNTARMLIEVEDFQQATEVLELLFGEDDEVVDTWYLFGWCFYLQGADNFKSAQYYLTKALEVDKKAPCGDEKLIQHVQELLQELGGPASLEDLEGEVPQEETQEDINRLEEDSEQEEDDMDTS